MRNTLVRIRSSLGVLIRKDDYLRIILNSWGFQSVKVLTYVSSP